MLNIARNINTGWNSTNANSLPEAEVIPIGESTNEKKKLERVTHQYSILYEHENIPLPGFTLFKASRKSWGSLDKTWLVIDPRGFLVRISNDNLESILHVTGITEGLIQEKCVWAREDSQTRMTLIPISSVLYKEAVENTELMEGKVDLKDVQIGDKVILQNKLTGTYMGIASLYGPISNYPSNGVFKPIVHLRKQIIKVKQGQYYFQTDLKILKVTDKVKVPRAKNDSVRDMNHDIVSNNVIFSNNAGLLTTAILRDKVLLISETPAKVTLTYEEITLLEAESLHIVAQQINDAGVLVLENNTGKKFIIDHPYFQSVPIHSFDISEIEYMASDGIVLKTHRTYSGGQVSKPYTLDMFTKFYKIVKNVKSNIYV